MGIGLVFLLCISGGFLLQNKHRTKSDLPMPKSVDLKIGKIQSSDEQSGAPAQQESFFLRPLPEELLQQLASMENLNEHVADAKFTGLRVLWPVYYFAHQDLGGGKANLLLDVSEDGFGVLIESEVELSAHPTIATLQSGQKIWIGGEILAVDPSGTGTIYLKAEHLHLKDEQPFETGQLQTK